MKKKNTREKNATENGRCATSLVNKASLNNVQRHPNGTKHLAVSLD
jgi:hypothetical protein